MTQAIVGATIFAVGVIFGAAITSTKKEKSE